MTAVRCSKHSLLSPRRARERANFSLSLSAAVQEEIALGEHTARPAFLRRSHLDACRVAKLMLVSTARAIHHIDNATH